MGDIELEAATRARDEQRRAENEAKRTFSFEKRKNDDSDDKRAIGSFACKG